MSQREPMTMNLNGAIVDVDSIEDAAAKWVHLRDSHDLGASDMNRNCGEVRSGTGQLVARISYNGRINKVS